MVYVRVDITKGENRTAAFIEKSPLGGLPVLEFDDGTYLTESVAICRFFEGTYPTPPLMGTDPRDIAFVEMWNRRMELEVFAPLANYLQHTHPIFKERVKQLPEFAEARLDHGTKRLEWLDSMLAQRQFIAGDRYTIADITAQVAVDISAAMGGYTIPAEALARGSVEPPQRQSLMSTERMGRFDIARTVSPLPRSVLRLPRSVLPLPRSELR
jgi:glutathione S-transferase